jgi:hypothetical protein
MQEDDVKVVIRQRSTTLIAVAAVKVTMGRKMICKRASGITVPNIPKCKFHSKSKRNRNFRTHTV